MIPEKVVAQPTPKPKPPTEADVICPWCAKPLTKWLAEKVKQMNSGSEKAMKTDSSVNQDSHE